MKRKKETHWMHGNWVHSKNVYSLKILYHDRVECSHRKTKNQNRSSRELKHQLRWRKEKLCRYLPVLRHCGLFFWREVQRSGQACWRSRRMWSKYNLWTRGGEKITNHLNGESQRHFFVKSHLRWLQIAEILQWRTQFFKYQSVYHSVGIHSTFNERRTTLHWWGR